MVWTRQGRILARAVKWRAVGIPGTSNLRKYCPNEGDDLPMLRKPIGHAVEAQNMDYGAVKPADLVIAAQSG